MEDLKPATIAPILHDNIAKESRLATDEAGHYLNVGKEFRGQWRRARNAIVVAEIKLCKAAVEVLLAAVLVNALRAALEDREIALNRIHMDFAYLAAVPRWDKGKRLKYRRFDQNEEARV